MRSLWRYIETLQLWKQIGLIAAFFLTLGISLKEALSFITRMYQEWRERCKDDEVVDYLIGQRELTVPEYDSYGQPTYPYYRSTLQAAMALGRSSVDIHHRLCKLEQSKRIDCLAPKADAWTVTDYELHDAKRRRKWFRRRK